jgi:ABC-type multidrug transport system fused ATPase/permease subunit
MKKNRFYYLFLLLTLTLILYPSTRAEAKVQSFSSLYMEVELREDTILLTSDTPNFDPQWEQIGITDPVAEKKTMKEMGVQAILYDPGSTSTVRLLSKHTSDSDKVFHLSLLTEEELTDYLDSIFTAPDENTTYAIEKYEHPEVPFYRLDLSLDKDGSHYSEIIYGTIANGYSISYDIFAQNKTEPLDEQFVKELVAGTHFTKILDKAEVEQQERKAMISLAVISGIIVAVLVAIILLRRRVRRKQYFKKKEKTEALSQFFIAERTKEEQNIKDTPLFSNHTTYSEEMIKTFYLYDHVWKKIKFWIVTVVILLLLIASFYSTGSIYVCIISVGVVGVFIYQYYSQTEKTIAREVKAYKSHKSSEAVFTFYENYYTLSGIQSSSKYPYLQVTEIKEYKNYVYIYLGAEKAHYLKKDGFEQGYEEFRSFMKDRIKVNQ